MSYSHDGNFVARLVRSSVLVLPGRMGRELLSLLTRASKSALSLQLSVVLGELGSMSHKSYPLD